MRFNFNEKKITKTIGARVDIKHYESIHQIAKDNKTSPSSVVREFIEFALTEYYKGL